MSKKISHLLMAFTATIMLGFTGMGYANPVQETPNALEMTGDLLIARPGLIVTTVAGLGIYVVSLPFSALGGNAGEAGHELVLNPAKAAFVRCLGCSIPGRKSADVVEQTEDTKTSG